MKRGRLRQTAGEGLLLPHIPLDCPVCDQGSQFELQEQDFNYGSDRERILFQKKYLSQSEREESPKQL